MTYLVTGTSSGIGRAVALRLAERGHDVIAGVRRASDAPAHSRIRPVTLDITDAAQLAAAAKDVGQLSGLVNSAGVTFASPVEHLPLDRLREQLEVNVVGLVAATQAFLPAIRAGRGRVVMIGSAAGRVATPFLGAYSASKFAVEAISDALRQELAPWGCPSSSSNRGVSSRGTGPAPKRPQRQTVQAWARTRSAGTVRPWTPSCSSAGRWRPMRVIRSVSPPSSNARLPRAAPGRDTS
jgi:NAD(P)-dependent dehydrogenase (short-subunit alcohol dehydrogenase family)